MGTVQTKQVGNAYVPTPVGGAEAEGAPPPPPAESPTVQSSPAQGRRSSLRASFLAVFGQQVLLAPEEPKPPPIDLNRLDVPKKENHPYQSFRVSKKIGHGGFAVVYTGHKASDATEKVAIKEIDTSQLSPKRLEDLNIEMNILSQLAHENIVRLFGVYMLNDKIYMIMEYLKGGELLQAICQREFYSEGDARKLLRQIASALHYIHQREVIHRDVKPENLILADVSFNSPVKLVDFGFSTTQTQVQSNPSAYLCGTRGYIAPEVLKDRNYSTKSDVWSLGVVFYIMLSGLMPFRTTKEGEVEVLSANFGFPAVRFAAVSKMAKDLISKMLSLDPEKRLSAKQVLEHPWTRISSQSSEHPDVDITGNLQSIRTWRAAQQQGSGWCFPALCCSANDVQVQEHMPPPPPSSVPTTTMPTRPDQPLEEQVMAHVSAHSSRRFMIFEKDFESSFKLQPSILEP